MTAGDLLIQKLADSIVSPLPTLPRPRKVQVNVPCGTKPSLKPDMLGQRFLPGAVFCPWCAARIRCAFHPPGHGSCASGEMATHQKHDVDLTCPYPKVDQSPLILPRSCPLDSDNLWLVEEQCIAHKVQSGKDFVLQTETKLLNRAELNASQWLNDAFRSMQRIDDETVSTNVSCSDTSYEGSETSDATDILANRASLLEEQFERNIVWARDGNWGVASRSHGTL